MSRVRSPTVSAQPSFDTTKFADLLKAEGFNDVQSAAIISLVSEAVGESMQTITRSMVRREELDSFLSESNIDFASLRRDIQSLERGDFALLRSELARITQDVVKIQEIIHEDVGRAHGGVRLDVNLEKARILDEAGQLERLIATAEERIEEEVGVVDFIIGLIACVGGYKLWQLRK
ncbi:hypothetical protein HDU67_007035 [Dinochytrium kinnereticum]|nr:hypothetical protein HDU67_007035 [Dinochytrium kinnereticum]